MFRYVALIWDAANSRQLDAVESLTRHLNNSTASWHAALHREGLRVFCADVQDGSQEPQLLAGGSGVVLGALFERNASPQDEAPARKVVLDEHATAAVLHSRGEWLTKACWGNYVVLLFDPDARRVRILKDPTGSLPAFSTSFQGVTLVFSAISACADMKLPPFTINRRFLELRIYGGEMTQERDALNEVSQIRRGECVEIDPRAQPSIVSRRFYWHPFRFHRSNELIDDVGQAAQALRNTLRSCTRTLAQCHQSALLRLSGGLDSSIILACLLDAPARPRLLSYTQYVPSGASDPRRWARIAVENAACEHTDFALTPAGVDLKAMLAMAPAAEPASALMYLMIGAYEQRIAAAREATAVFSGDGGDNAFGSYCIGEVVHAYLRRCGPRPAALRLAAQSAAILQQTTWTTIGRALRTWTTRQPLRTLQSENRETTKLVCADIVRDGERTGNRHPWLSGVDRAPWEPLSKLGMLLGTPDLYAGAGRPAATAPQIVSPIYSQPVMELSLRIPADVLFADGRERGLARRAFAGYVAAPILNRAWKDHAGTFHDELIHRNLDWLREIFLDGVLVRERLLDPAAVDRALSAKLVKTRVFPAEILRHLDTEIWARHWKFGR